MKTRQDADSEESKNIDVDIHEQYRLLKPEQWEQIKPAFEAVQGSWINAPFNNAESKLSPNHEVPAVTIDSG